MINSNRPEPEDGGSNRRGPVEDWWRTDGGLVLRLAADREGGWYKL